MGAPEWSDEELSTLKAHYRKHRTKKWRGWGRVLPGRSVDAIARKAGQLGLTKKKRSNRPWTDEESAELLRFLIDMSERTGRTPMGIALHAEWMCQKARGMVDTAKRAEGRIA